MVTVVIYTHVLRLDCCWRTDGILHLLSEGFTPPPCACGVEADLSKAVPISNGWTYYHVGAKRWQFSESEPTWAVKRLRRLENGHLHPCAEDIL